MTLPESGAISLGQIATEFGLAANAVFPTAFYGKGGAPASGPLSFSDFYGRSNVAFTPDGGTVSDDEVDTFAQIVLTCTQAATWTYTRSGSTAGSANVASGASATSVTFSLGFPPGTAAGSRSCQFNVTGASGGVTRNFTVLLTAENSGSNR